ncbi:MAG: SpoIID/LytB domain-containing protein [Patescibacteria group bacterium]|nr:SpoIID/LytB domain-containing protein [Patescibacteria group bacterium]
MVDVRLHPDREPIPTGLPCPKSAISRHSDAKNLVEISRIFLLGFRADWREIIRFRLGNPYRYGLIGPSLTRAARLLLFAALSMTVVLAPAATHAATPTYAAKELIRSEQRVVMAPGESRAFSIGYKNVGTATWKAGSKNFISVYTYSPYSRKSVFQDSTWLNDAQPARLTEAEVRPGALGRFSFTLYAPLQPGDYKETFRVAAEDLTWVKDALFTVNITVKESETVSASPSGNISFVDNNNAVGYKAMKLISSAEKLSLEGGEKATYRVAFKNVGRTNWQQNGSTPLVLRAAPGNAYSFRDSTWSGMDKVSQLTSTVLKPGELGFFNVTLTAPTVPGVYLAKFVLAAGDFPIDGGGVELPIEVRQGKIPASVDMAYDEDLSNSGQRGPNIRVGLFTTTQPVIIAAPGAYTLVNSNDQLVAHFSGVTTITFDFSQMIYRVQNGTAIYTFDKHPRLQPDDPASTIFEIQSYESRPTWDTSVNFNKFRGALEVLYAPATAKLWVIEELPVEDYMRGLAETSNGSPFEYQKALVTAARTYALYVVAIGGKHQSEYHDVNTTGNDQVYKGYASELVRPNVVRAAEETRGSVVIYNGEIVVTPYFSRSDGRTRSWTEVWSSTPHPWLISKPCPHDAGLDLWGHGVGLSANDAVGRANDGESWTDILKYYYTGVEIKRLY